jgi:putative phage-type endonuclease
MYDNHNNYMEELLDELAFVEQFVLESLEAPLKAWRRYLGSTYDDPLVKLLVDGWMLCSTAAATAQAQAQVQENPLWVKYTLSAPQIEQRTEAWYAQTLNVLTASEIWTVLKPSAATRERALLVMSKVESQPRRGNNLCVPSEFMSAFDWGIRFEPVIKHLYEHKYGGVKIADVGRIVHPTEPRVAASPDGVVLCPEFARLIEIKCPVSREIGEGIPPEYYAQMQTQMEVTGAPACDYVEARLRSAYRAGTIQVEGPAIARGTIWRISDAEDKETYIYGPAAYRSETANINVGVTYKDTDTVLETIEWELMGWNEVRVARDRGWWDNAYKKILSFWEDVEVARVGNFVVPEAKRRRKEGFGVGTAATEKCMIQFRVEAVPAADATTTPKDSADTTTCTVQASNT